MTYKHMQITGNITKSLDSRNNPKVNIAKKRTVKSVEKMEPSRSRQNHVQQAFHIHSKCDKLGTIVNL